MEINIFQVDAFSSKPFGGNPAGVVPNARWIKVEDMQRIANEMNLSETAFIQQLDDNIFKIRFFTPVCEVDLCGHATIASFFTLAKKGYFKPIENGKKTTYLETSIGRLPIDIYFNNSEPDYVVMEQGEPKSLGVVELLDEVLASMNIDRSHIGIIDEFIDPEIVSTGLPDIILPIKDKKVLDELEVDFCTLKEVCKRLNVTGVHAFYLPELNSEVAYARNFAPLVGIDEESATGTANGALIYYLKKNSLIKGNKLVVNQGETLKRPSLIYCYIEEKEDKYKVKVGGSANIIIDGIMKY